MGKPNIVLIVLDSVRADHLGCYGYERETSPNMDRMADEGLKFERCYANSFCSVPSHSSLFTGKLPSEHRMFQYLDPYFDQENRLVKGLKSKGYYTYGNSNNIYINSRYGFDRDFDEFDHQMWASDIGNDNTRELINDIQSTGWNSRKEKYLGAFKKTLKNPQALLRMASLKFERKWGRKYGLVDQGAKKA